MKLKAIVSHLVFSHTGVSFRLQIIPLAVQRSTLKIFIDQKIGDDSQKGPPGIKGC